MGRSIHAVRCGGRRHRPGRREARRVLTNDPGMGVIRHVDAGYEYAAKVADERGPHPDEGTGVSFDSLRRRCATSAATPAVAVLPIARPQSISRCASGPPARPRDADRGRGGSQRQPVGVVAATRAQGRPPRRLRYRIAPGLRYPTAAPSTDHSASSRHSPRSICCAPTVSHRASRWASSPSPTRRAPASGSPASDPTIDRGTATRPCAESARRRRHHAGRCAAKAGRRPEHLGADLDLAERVGSTSNCTSNRAARWTS
jgi:hypothetical protein